MALLTSDSLLDCFFIPDFIPSGSKMVFENSNAPISWTKDSTPNDTTLRIINGSISSNLLNQTFSSVFSNRSFSYSTSPNPSGTVTVNPSPAGVSALGSASAFVTFGPAVFNTASHTHEYISTGENLRRGGFQVRNWDFQFQLDYSGSSGSHIHTSTTIGANHSHPHPGGAHIHPITDSVHTHNAISPLPAVDFRINYKDFIIATKD